MFFDEFANFFAIRYEKVYICTPDNQILSATALLCLKDKDNNLYYCLKTEKTNKIYNPESHLIES